MFNQNLFDQYSFEEIPLDCDIYVVDEIYMNEYENMMLRFFEGAEYEPIGSVSFVAARNINDSSVELSWYANISDRFHQIEISLPRDQFVACVGSWQCDEKPRIFVKSEWLENIYVRTYSIFALIDAADVKNALARGLIKRSHLINLRSEIDKIANRYPDISFISFGDSLLLKSNWSVGYSKIDMKYTYSPEVFISLAAEINGIYQNVLDLKAYAVITQGSNEYYDDSSIHISSLGNHVCLNSLGIPFAQLMEIETEARKAIRANIHDRADLYIDESYFHSLKFRYGFEKKTESSNDYQSKMMSTPSKYYYFSYESILKNLDKKK